MNDMSSVITPKSDQWNADDLIAGPRTIRIADVKISPGTEQPVSIVIEGDGKVFRPCKSMSRVLVAAWGPDAKAYVGRSATLYRDPSVKWGGMEVGGIRISHLSHIERELVMALTATKGSRKPHSVKPLAASVATVATPSGAIAEIAACPDQAALRQWWNDNGEAIPDAQYDAVLDAFNARLAAVKRPKPALDQVEQTESIGEAIQSDTAANQSALDEALTVIGSAPTRDEVTERVDRMKARLPDHAAALDAAGDARRVELGE